ncbi:NADPH-dependent FMN reductase [Sphingobacterium faecium]|uniref:NADPH-dependent FMN reductase n=1 Tax=Sphingobacterium faecium TaxID=34087 RepID=UPI00320A657F
MKVLIFSGALERRPQSTSGKLSAYFIDQLSDIGVETEVFNLADSGIPLFDITLGKKPIAVEVMINKFQEADAHIWLAPLYHGSIPGVMKNCLDWLELTSQFPKPYLMDKMIGLVSWADGAQAMQGINTMDAVAKSLRAWPLPFSVPITRSELFHLSDPQRISALYAAKLDLMVRLISTKHIATFKQEKTERI